MEQPLLLSACRAGAFGAIHREADCTVCEAGFIYLDGKPSPYWFNELYRRWKDRVFICLSAPWDRELQEAHLFTGSRYQMELSHPRSTEELRGFCSGIPREYRLLGFGPATFDRHPFGHGRNYADARDFARRGAGACVWLGKEIVSSASSYLSWQDGVEVDVSTLSEHRGRGLALACSASLLLLCRERKLSPHWDAQNAESRRLAEKLGYTLLREYKIYHF